MLIDESPVVDLRWIFGGPIEAVIRANIMAAKAFVDFIKEDGFVDPAIGEMFGGLKMITFSFEQPGGPNGLPITRLFRVPWLSLIPLPLLEVKDATFEFGVCVLATASEEHGLRNANLLRGGDPPDPDDGPKTWRGMLAPSRPRNPDETRPDLAPYLAANLEAKVRVGQADIPAGIRNILAIMGENAQLTPALLMLQPSSLEFAPELDRPHVPIVLQAVTDAQESKAPPSITAYYDTNLVSLSILGETWGSGHRRSTDRSGRLEAEVRMTGEPPLGSDTPTILFRTEIDSAVAVAEAACTIRQLSRRRTR